MIELASKKFFRLIKIKFKKKSLGIHFQRKNELGVA